MPNDTDEKLKLIEIIREAIARDNELREKFQIGDKFRFVRDRLQELLCNLEQSLPVVVGDKMQSLQAMAADEMAVYVYLYNTHGLQFRTWQNLVTPKVFYEYSVNRPIYAEKSQIESLLRTKTNKAQHAYLTVAIKRDQVIPYPADSGPKDIAGNPVIKVREGSLRFEKLIAFTHQDQNYKLGADGELVKA
jgi:hypothetical protein